MERAKKNARGQGIARGTVDVVSVISRANAALSRIVVSASIQTLIVYGRVAIALVDS